MPSLEPIKPIDRTINDLSLIDKKHWELHLNALKKDSPFVSAEVDKLLISAKEIPNLKHPSDIHEWFERPELRDRLEKITIGAKLNG